VQLKPWPAAIRAIDSACPTLSMEYGPTEILPPVGPMLPRPARLCRPRRSPRPAHPRKTAASRPRKANLSSEMQSQAEPARRIGSFELFGDFVEPVSFAVPEVGAQAFILLATATATGALEIAL
jgi:hypothetical protein